MMWIFSTILTQQLISALPQWSSNSSIGAAADQVPPKLFHQVSRGDHSSRYNGAAPFIATDEYGLLMAPNDTGARVDTLPLKVDEDIAQPLELSTESAIHTLDQIPIEPGPMHPVDTGSNYESAADQITFSEGYRTLAIATAAAMPVGLTATGLVWYLQKKKDNGKHESMDLNGGHIDDESSMGETTEDAFESKFEVGSDATMWAHQADFSAI
eukprot:Protomagalhaensia_sp_Gyna_25__2546@NODE_243_length_4207_cov_228_083493_g185_i1_p3_GENE_NODE_243_length_4207_cov_228_083493_g185_i1NODE_243_length_4207_cov_228_083493_g185_i1_p3_ORF_typecomplete_len213_score33_75Tweety/PF04906_13/0_28_NODE_243_length_4207_cov_228_083493_g185_i124863124